MGPQLALGSVPKVGEQWLHIKLIIGFWGFEVVLCSGAAPRPRRREGPADLSEGKLQARQEATYKAPTGGRAGILGGCGCDRPRACGALAKTAVRCNNCKPAAENTGGYSYSRVPIPNL